MKLKEDGFIISEFPQSVKRFNYAYALQEFDRMGQAQLTYTLTGLSATFIIAMEHFVYRSEANYYDAGKHASMNYWKIANFVGLWSGLPIMALATLT